MGKGIGFSTVEEQFDYAKMKSTIQEALRKVFNPEFLNRVDDVLVFRPLEKEHILQIIDILTETLYKRVEALGYRLELSKQAREFIAEKGYDPKFGARPLKRAIQKYVEDPMAEELLTGKREEGSVLRIKTNAANDALEFEWEAPEVAKKEASDATETTNA
jgi:ATP-dependent Clp protease ATP-binding subunit ClpC